MPEPLKRKMRDGTPYQRPPEIEAWVKKLETVEVAERLRQFEPLSRKSSGYVPSEVLVYFLRRARPDCVQGDFEKIFRMLLNRIQQSLRSAIFDSSKADAQDIREEIMGRFAEWIAKDCNGCASLLDFYEIRFDKAFASFRTSVLRQIGPSVVDMVSLSTDKGDGLEISAEVEAAAADFLGGNSSRLDDPAFRSALDAAIGGLPDEQKRVIGLLWQGFQIDSKDKNVMTIANILKCDERTIRNRRDRACKALKAILQEENPQ